ncbi:plasmid pRiA4b ORF-3 family protein [Nocardioides sp.]|uniref:plasmid pRiA4b ORF-3 family protein n=1 Tax=Nocardioides sp. TaxID=35761 RepID=UPI00271B0F50|nr:plasmid pRiA4b ORF-3 family protein [Nocardioides sp.]MDO9456595.1 plasmid pRiA4b ORF-3 family protein [Nocardioides sp.]
MPPRQRRARSGNVTALPGVDLAALLVEQGIDLGGLDPLDPFARRRPVPLDVPAETQTYRVRVELDGVRPVVWRRLELAGDLTLEDLHGVLQAAMDWGDIHLHAFVMGPGRRDPRLAPFLTEFDLDETDDGVPEADVRLDQVLREAGDRLYYDYDFGDGWEHRIKVEVVLPLVDGAPRATCTGGARACPPDDVGGVVGYDEMLQALRSGPTDDWAIEKLDWLPEGFDPAAFDLARTDEQVQLALDGAGPVLTELVDGLLDRLTSSAHTTVSAWAEAASRTPITYDEQAVVAVVAPWMALLDHVGDGVALTGAGYLKPASVEHLVSVLRDGGRLGRGSDVAMGKGNREENVRPVAWLHGSARTCGLVRKAKGRLLPTPAGNACRGNPVRLLLLLADRLPIGRKGHELDAGLLVLLAAVAGVPMPRDGLPQLLTAAGWRTPDRQPVPAGAAHDWARSTDQVLQLAGWNVDDSFELAHDPRASLLALLAVREDR